MSHLSLPTSLLWYPECYEVSMSGWQAFPGASRHSTRGGPVSRVWLWEESQTGPWRGAVASSRPREGLFRHTLPFSFSRARTEGISHSSQAQLSPPPCIHLSGPAQQAGVLPGFLSISAQPLPPQLLEFNLPAYVVDGFCLLHSALCKVQVGVFFPISTLIIRTSTTKFPK